MAIDQQIRPSLGLNYDSCPFPHITNPCFCIFIDELSLHSSLCLVPTLLYQVQGTIVIQGQRLLKRDVLVGKNIF